MREAMQRALTPIEIDLLFAAAKAINKLVDAWTIPGTTRQNQEEALE